MTHGIIALLLTFILALKPVTAAQYIIGIEPMIANINCINRRPCQVNSRKDIVILNKIKQTLSLEFSYKEFPIRRLYASFINGSSLDFKYPDNPNWKSNLKRNKAIYYSDAIRQYTDGTFTQKQTCSDFSNAHINKLGTLRGFTAEPYLEAIKSKQISLIEFDYMEQLVNSLLAKRIDAIYVNEDYIGSHLNQNNYDIVYVSCHLLREYYLSTIKHPDLIEQINQLLKASNKH